ncbi:MAG: DUF502 domain-containing protein [Bdellovibrionales bacterium]|nr:DUF502 domain-containing protein [Bdellovibrionales bacterium]
MGSASSGQFLHSRYGDCLWSFIYIYPGPFPFSLFGNKAHQLLDRLFRQVPLVKSIYIAIQDLTDYFSPEKAQVEMDKSLR